ncbi:PAS domain-containing protein [Pseudomonas sp. HK3]
MKARELISILEQYDDDMDVSVSFSDKKDTPIHITSCDSLQTRCYQNLVELSPEGLLVLNNQNQISYMNPFLVKKLGTEDDALFFKPIHDLISIEDHCLLNKALNNLKVQQADFVSIPIIKENSESFWARISMTKIPSSDNSYRGAILTITDTSERQKLLEKNTSDTLDHKVGRIPDHINQLKQTKSLLLEERASLESTNLIQATPYWHQEKYLYLIFPKKDGKRVREYIGTKKQKVDEALNAIKRGKRYRKICDELADIDQQLRTATFKLDSFLWELAKLPPNLHKTLN